MRSSFLLHFPQFPEAGEACFPRESEGFGLSSLVGCTPETAIIKEDSPFSRRFPPPPVRKLRKVQVYLHFQQQSITHAAKASRRSAVAWISSLDGPARRVA